MAELRTDQERIVGTDFLLMAFNVDRALRERKRFVDLACGHKAYTGAVDRCVCRRCTEMLRRSLADGSEDYKAFRAGALPDKMVWLDDPCRALNEPTDLDGRFIRDP